MKHEKIIKRRDGSRVRITATLYTCSSIELKWSCYSHYCEPGKRIFKIVVPEAATPEEKLEAQLELWNQIKPTL